MVPLGDFAAHPARPAASLGAPSGTTRGRTRPASPRPAADPPLRQSYRDSALRRCTISTLSGYCTTPSTEYFPGYHHNIVENSNADCLVDWRYVVTVYCVFRGNISLSGSFLRGFYGYPALIDADWIRSLQVRMNTWISE